MNIRTFTHDDRIFSYTDVVQKIPSAVTEQMIATLNAWSNVFPQEGTFPQTQWGVPSIIARFDGVLSGDNTRFLSYEVESCPTGLGYGTIVSQEFKDTLNRFKKNIWPPFSKLVGPTPDMTQDEGLWLPEVTLSDAMEGDGLLLVRLVGPRDHRQYKEKLGSLIARSVTPMWHRHNKSYGVKLGWWKEVGDVVPQTGETLPWHESFVLKPMYGKQGHDVFAWGPALKGKSTRTQIMGALERNRRMFLQPFIPPMEMDIGGKSYNYMLRPYFGFRPDRKVWEPIGGMWVARPYPNLRLHWASDSISGPLHIEAAA